MKMGSSTDSSAWVAGHKRRQRQYTFNRKASKVKNEEQDKMSIGNFSNDPNLDAISKNSGGTSSGLHLVDIGNKVDDRITSEILSRLPMKSLMRFKCVCKPWRSLVENDSYFIDVHRTHLNTCWNFFAVVYENTFWKVFLVTANYLSLEKGKGKNTVDIHDLREFNVPSEVGVFGPLNGLIGFYNHRHYCGVRLSNVCTQETTPWMKSASVRECEQHNILSDRYGTCQLGFDPVSREHKVVCIWMRRHPNRFPHEMICEVLTVGDHEWRRIDGDNQPHMDYIFKRSSVYLNGSIYYKPLNFNRKARGFSDKIVVFDVGTEKFRVITIPHFIVNHPREDETTIDNPVDLFDLDGHLTLLCKVNCHTVKLWLYDNNDVDDGKRMNFWREIAIELPYIWDEYRRLTFYSVVGKNQIIIKSFKGFNISYHCYNWRKKTFLQVDMDGMFSAIRHMFNIPSCEGYWDKIFMGAFCLMNATFL